MGDHLFGGDITVAARCHDIARGLNGWGAGLFGEIIRCGNAARVALMMHGRGEMDRTDFLGWALAGHSITEAELTNTIELLVRIGAVVSQGGKVTIALDGDLRGAFSRIGMHLKGRELGELERTTLLIIEALSGGEQEIGALHGLEGVGDIDRAVAVGISSGFIKKKRDRQGTWLSSSCMTEAVALLRGPAVLAG